MEHQDSMGSRLQVRKIRSSVRFPTLFSKLVFIYISILVIILVMLFATFAQFFQSFFITYTENMMINQAKYITKKYCVSGKAYDELSDNLKAMSHDIKLMNEYLQATTWIIDTTGKGYEFSKEGEMRRLTKAIVNDKILKEVFSGKVVGYENGFYDYFDIPILSVGYPIIENGKADYVLFIHSPMPYVVETIEDAKLLILKVIGLVGAILFVWIYFIARQMTRPLKEMNHIAKGMASGGFKDRIEVEGRDEIAQLGLSLNHMAEELDKIEENRRSFISNISHDLRSPLTSISGYVTAILDGTIDHERQEKYLKIVLSEAQRLISMSNAILDLNHMQEDLPLELTSFNINQMIARILLAFEGRCQKRHIHLYSDLDQEHTNVVAQNDSINRVIQNLMENAYKFVNDGGDILVRTRLREGKLWVSVFNSGPHIPKEQQALIWDRFYKCDVSRGQDKSGNGLGLVIVKEIIRKHHEEFGVHSEENEMVEFYFSLSLA